MNDERKAFEAWAKGKVTSLHRRHGLYYTADAARAWDAWQAARATLPQPAEPAAAQGEPVAYVPYCHTDGETCIQGEYRWDEIAEKPFEVADPESWMCLPLYASPSQPQPGWRMVPEEPTPEMVYAGRLGWAFGIPHAWSEMLSASPQPQTGTDGVSEFDGSPYLGRYATADDGVTVTTNDAEPHCRVEEIPLTDEQRKLLSVARDVTIPGADGVAPSRQPLSDAEIISLLDSSGVGFNTTEAAWTIVRAVERAHGVGVKGLDDAQR